MKYFIDTEFHEYKKKPFLQKHIDTIELISIGIVTDNGREYYAICNEFDACNAFKNEWLRDNVLKSIYLEIIKQYHGDSRNRVLDKYSFTITGFKRMMRHFGKSRKQIAKEIKQFVYSCEGVEFHRNDISGNEHWSYAPLNTNPQFYAYYADYDWVVFCWIFGRMIDLPKGFPMYCRDLKQIMDEKGLSKDWKKDYCPDPIGEHNALIDKATSLDIPMDKWGFGRAIDFDEVTKKD